MKCTKELLCIYFSRKEEQDKCLSCPFLCREDKKHDKEINKEENKGD